MAKVVIDGVEYAPKYEPDREQENTHECPKHGVESCNGRVGIKIKKSGGDWIFQEGGVHSCTAWDKVWWINGEIM